MIKIESDNAAIEKEIRFLEKTVVENGGELDPGLVIQCEDGELSVMKDSLIRLGKPLMAIPEDLLLPAERMGLSVKGDQILMNPEKGVMSDTQHKIAASMVELYNLTDKIAHHKNSCPWVWFRGTPEPFEKLLAGRTLNENQEKMLAYTQNKPGCEDTEKFLCDTYLKTRVIGHKEVDQKTEEKSLAMKIMPIVDFINHDFFAGNFNFGINYSTEEPDREFLFLAPSQPILERRECFAFYNQMDAVDAFLHYGFPDARAPIVRSVPMEIDVPKTGKIVLNSTLCPWKKGKLAKHIAGIQTFIPLTVKNEEGLIEISHLLIPVMQSPQALRRVLRLIISNMRPHVLTQDEMWEATLAAEEQIIMANISFYEQLANDTKAALDSRGKDDPESPYWRQIKDLANLQLTKLYKYVFYKEFYERQGVEPAANAAE
ncbi:MAG: hypothetical protein H6868_00920 [Rhodospirillales bacterium]|nr:hypothetical protein [Rhodospirillales bacterium]